MVDFDKLLNKMTAPLANPFKKVTADERVAMQEIELSVKKDIQIFSAMAKELFDDQRYIKLKNEFQRIYNQNLRLLIYTDFKDLSEVKKIQTQIVTLKNIFDTPEGFVKSAEAMNANKNK